jgi:hypothetical protein
MGLPGLHRQRGGTSGEMWRDLSGKSFVL